MVSLMSLWLPILVSAVFVFLVSWILHMVLPHHRSDFGGVPNEDDLMESLRRHNVAPGDYMVPHGAGPEAMKSPAFQEKMKKGPIVIMSVVRGGSMSMGRNLALWFVYCLVVGVFAAYVTSRAVGAEYSYLTVHRFAGAVAFACYTMALWQESIWYQRKWSTTIKNAIDGLLYALVTGGTFGWLWPR